MPESGSPELDTGSTSRTPPTIEEAARLILLEIAPADVRFLPLACVDFFGNAVARRRAVRATLRGRERDQPTGFVTGEDMQLVLGVVLTLLNGVACEVLTGMATERVGRVRSWWQDRRRRGADLGHRPAGRAHAAAPAQRDRGGGDRPPGGRDRPPGRVS